MVIDVSVVKHFLTTESKGGLQPNTKGGVKLYLFAASGRTKYGTGSFIDKEGYTNKSISVPQTPPDVTDSTGGACKF